ncbi:hypothetical protein XENOCAPTIV_015890 [Xenoophorus captivus]|uniref:Cadherin domain-containing protein n=1 Tax=Xenoophorus captivus TaxID=1517983 RepID=A0ABV0QN11_9TELE
MMAWLQLWTAGFIVTLAFLFFVVICQDSGLSGVVPERQDSADIVKKESYPVLLRQKRAWLWNALYVTEETAVSIPHNIGKLRSSLNVEVKTFTIEGEGANDIFTVDNQGDLYVTTSLDREKKALYHLKARMFDGNHKLMEDAGDFIVHVTDINDNCPVFPTEYNESVLERISKYEISVPENLKVNEEIGVLEVEDRDQIENKQPIFSIPSDGDKIFGTKPNLDKNCVLMLKQNKPSYRPHRREGFLRAKLFTNAFDTLQLSILVTVNNPVKRIFPSMCCPVHR